MSTTGDRRHGTVSPRLLPIMARSMTTPRPTDVEEAARQGVAGFKLIAGPHFDADEIGASVRLAPPPVRDDLGPRTLPVY
jgi:hypothetical protein